MSRSIPLDPTERCGLLSANPAPFTVESAAVKTISTSYVPIVQVQLGPAYASSRVAVAQICVGAMGDEVRFAWALLLNPTLGAGTAASFAAETGTPVEYDVAATGAVTGYERRLAGGPGNTVHLEQLDEVNFPTGLRSGDIVSLCGVAPIADVDFWGAISLRPYGVALV